MPDQETDKKLDRVITTVENIERLLLRHDKVIFGSLENDEYPGLMMDVDRLKNHKKNQDKTALVVWSTAVGLFVKTVWDAMFFSHKG